MKEFQRTILSTPSLWIWNRSQSVFFKIRTSCKQQQKYYDTMEIILGNTAYINYQIYSFHLCMATASKKCLFENQKRKKKRILPRSMVLDSGYAVCYDILKTSPELPNFFSLNPSWRDKKCEALEQNFQFRRVKLHSRSLGGKTQRVCLGTVFKICLLF